MARGDKPRPKVAVDAELAKIQNSWKTCKSLEALPRPEPSTGKRSAKSRFPCNRRAPMPTFPAWAPWRAAICRGRAVGAKASEDLARIQQAVGGAAAQRQPRRCRAKRADVNWRAQALCRRSSKSKTKLLEVTQSSWTPRSSKGIAAQRDPLENLSRRQRVIVSAAAQAGFPPTRAGVDAGERLTDLTNALVRDAAGPLKSAVVPLGGRGGSAWAWRRLAGPAGGGGRGNFADLQPRHRPGVGAGRAGPGAEEAGRAQSSVKDKTRVLQGELESLEAKLGELPGGVVGKVAAAQGEQAAAAAALSRRDSSAALPPSTKGAGASSDGDGQMGQSFVGPAGYAGRHDAGRFSGRGRREDHA